MHLEHPDNDFYFNFTDKHEDWVLLHFFREIDALSRFSAVFFFFFFFFFSQREVTPINSCLFLYTKAHWKWISTQKEIIYYLRNEIFLSKVSPDLSVSNNVQLMRFSCVKPNSVAQSDACPTGDQEVAGSPFRW